MMDTPEPVQSETPPNGGNPIYVAPPGWEPRKKKSAWSKAAGYIVSLLLILSIIFNVYMAIAIKELAPSFKLSPRLVQDGDKTQVIAVYSLTGVIDSSKVPTFLSFYEKVKTDKNIKAVVLRINSPGGAVAPSEQILHYLKRIKTYRPDVPIVISMGGVAASGGYLISCGGEFIIAEPATITGSIGVIAQIPNLEGTMEKLGVKMKVVKSQNAEYWKDQLSPYREPSQRDLAYLVHILDDIQTRFENTVRAGRGPRLKPKEETLTISLKDGKEKTVKEMAPFNGKIYLAEEAETLGLIDEVGFMTDAFEKAVELAKLDNPKIVSYTPRKGLLIQLLIGSAKMPDLGTLSPGELQTPKILMQWMVPTETVETP